MKYFILIILTLFIAADYTYPQLSKKYRKKVIRNGIKVKVYKVLDSQTLLVIQNRKKVKVRLMGITGVANEGLPELEKKAIIFIKRKVLRKRVYLLYTKEKVDENNVQQALIYYPNRVKYLLNASLLKNGYASVAKNSSHWLKKEFLELEKYAQTKKNGLWFYKNPSQPVKEAFKNPDENSILEPDEPLTEPME